MSIIFNMALWALVMISFLYLFIFVDVKGQGMAASVKRFFYVSVPGVFGSCLYSIGCEPVVLAL